MQLIGSALLILSLFLNWYSDVDVFRSGDIYTGLNGPLYFVGLNLLILGIVNIALTLGKSMRLNWLRRLTGVTMGKLQMIFGFSAMYLLIIVNSVYFNPQFGLNILSKKSEIGVMLALISAVLICVGGYLAFRRKFEIEEQIQERPEELVKVEIQQERIPATTVRPAAPDMAKETLVAEEKPAPTYSGGMSEKTDYERTKAYDSLKKMMLKDTLTPDQRRREREKGPKENAFSANFGKNESVKTPVKKSAPAGTAEKTSAEKKAQMYRMDL